MPPPGRGSWFHLVAVTEYIFEWDPVKAAENVRKHGVTFEEASLVFRDPLQKSRYDDEHLV
jgi:uncharacterized DUF497 family protein